VTNWAYGQSDGIVSRLSARTRDLDTPVDLLAVAGEDGVIFETAEWGIAGRGVAHSVEVDYSTSSLRAAFEDVRTALSSLDRTSGAQPVAFVTIPFAPTQPLLAIIPEATVTRTGDECSMTTVAEADLAIPTFTPPAFIDPPASYDLSSSRSPKRWRLAVEEAVRRLLDGELDKVVLAREVVLTASTDFSQVAALQHLRRTYPGAYRFAIDGFLGASPELLVGRDGREVHAKPLAGTLPRKVDEAADQAQRTALLHSEKNRAEHRYLSDMMRETLEPFCAELNVPVAPEVLSLANVHHLATPVHGILRDPETSVLDLVAALHPTPAVGGMPTNRAIELIEELEDMDRGRYAGAVGWVDADGNGSFVIAIRCAQLRGNIAHLYAGCGIVAASSPERELEETQWKLQPMLTALIRP
jgi:menaquinone-specific isochorismate synthase